MCSKLHISVTNWFQQNIERLEMCSANTLYVSDCLKLGVEREQFLKCSILHFPTHGHSWVSQVYHLHTTLKPVLLQLPQQILMKPKTNIKSNGVPKE